MAHGVICMAAYSFAKMTNDNVLASLAMEWAGALSWMNFSDFSSEQACDQSAKDEFVSSSHLLDQRLKNNLKSLRLILFGTESDFQRITTNC